MGLAAWGAVAGAAGAASKEVDRKRAQADSAVSNARQEALIRLRAKMQDKNSAASDTRQNEAALEQRGYNEEVAAGQAEAASKAATDERAFDSTEAQLDRDSKEKIAAGKLTQAAEGDTSKSNAWTPKTSTITTVDPTTNLPMQTSVISLVSPTGLVLTQSGSRLLPQGTTAADIKSKRRPSKDELNKLFTDAVSPEQHIKKFGYLPLGYARYAAEK